VTIYRFGSFEFDDSAGELRRDGRPVELQPKPLELLRLLLRERGRVVPLDELFEKLWPGTAVTPGSLTRAVSLARRAIGDTHKGQTIRSFPRRGYRFMAEVFEVAEPGATPAPRSVARPASRVPSAAPSPGPPRGDLFVGREDALSTLHEAWQEAAAGRGQLVLVQGRPGVGKTRLVEVFAEHVGSPAHPVLFARARDGEGVPAFWMWAQVLRKLSGPDVERGDLGSIVASVPELQHLVPGVEAGDGSAELTPEQGRFLFFDAVHQLLARRAREYPLMLVLDDLQWAGEPSLRLLEHLVYEIARDPILLVATIREEPREPGDVFGRTLSLLRQRPCSRTVGLAGFTRGEVATLLEQLIGRPPPSDLTSELVARTGGIPLFVREAVRILAERGELAHPERIARHGISLPQESLDLIRRTVSGLSPEAARLIGACSVLGRAFSLRFLAAVVDLSPECVLDLLDEAATAGIVEPAPDRAGTYRFQHALHREAAYAALSIAERTRLHLRAAEQLERTPAARLDRVLGELAHHHYHAIGVGDPRLAHRRCVQAGQRAAGQFAYEEAATHFEHALACLEHADEADVDEHLDTLLQLGEAHRLSGDRDRRRAVFGQALELAGAHDRPDLVARAAIGICDLSEWGVPDDVARTALEKALSLCGEAGGIDRVRLLTRLAYLEAATANAELERVARKAVAGARAAGDPAALQEALYVLHFRLAGPDHLDERERLSREVVQNAVLTHHHHPALICLIDSACDCITRGDVGGARARREDARRLAGERPYPGLAWHLRAHDAGVALMEGRLADAEALARDAFALGQRIRHPYARGVHLGLMACIARERGDLETVLATVSPALRATQGAWHWLRAVAARAHLTLGQRDAAEQLYLQVRGEGFETIPRNIRWTATAVEIGLLCAELDAVDDAARLAELLHGAEGLHGVLPIPVCYGGPISHPLGLLRAMLGDVDDALVLLEDAIESTGALGARPARARAERDLARILVRRGDRERAASLMRSASETAVELQMAGLLARLEADQARQKPG
jgi:DNA-binding winged helix-turn-helix (wHTH) protein/tetratricopeptide (TPR) repeat protein